MRLFSLFFFLFSGCSQLVIDDGDILNELGDPVGYFECVENDAQQPQINIRVIDYERYTDDINISPILIGTVGDSGFFTHLHFFDDDLIGTHYNIGCEGITITDAAILWQ